MSNTTQASEETQNNRSLSEVGRSTPRGIPTQRKLLGQRLRTEFGFLLFLQYRGQLSPGQWAYLLAQQRKLKFEELQSAIRLFNNLLVSRRSAARAEGLLKEVLLRTPSLPPKSIRREQRRIGVGYRDKGTLRLPHEDHLAPPMTWWWQDIALLQHLSPEWVIPERHLDTEDLAQGNLLEPLGNIVRSLGLPAIILTLDSWHDPEPPEVFTLESEDTKS